MLIGDLRVVAGAHLIPHELLDVLVGGIGRQLGRVRRGVLAERVRILAADAEQVAVEVDGEAAAERLRDEARLRPAQGDVSSPAGITTAFTSRASMTGSFSSVHAHSVDTGWALAGRARR